MSLASITTGKCTLIQVDFVERFGYIDYKFSSHFGNHYLGFTHAAFILINRNYSEIRNTRIREMYNLIAHL